MNDTAVLQKVEALAKTVERLQERVEDLEDLRDLKAAPSLKTAMNRSSLGKKQKAELNID